tara:strand:+ start:7843 stop:8064 length:222 start_codon:yes stop_codon:yes gene_type:complete
LSVIASPFSKACPECCDKLRTSFIEGLRATKSRHIKNVNYLMHPVVNISAVLQSLKICVISGLFNLLSRDVEV